MIASVGSDHGVRSSCRRGRVSDARAVLIALGGLLCFSLVGPATAQARVLGEAWHKTYDGPARKADAFAGAAIAGNGNPVAIGYATVGHGHGTDVLLIRFSGAGAKKWTRLWNGPASRNDRAAAIARDNRGNFYVAGTTAGGGGDLLLLRYAPDGHLLWWRRYDSGGSRHDEGLFVEVDKARNAYVVGTSQTATGIVWRIVKYGSNGRRHWVKTYRAPTGNAYPTGVDGNGAGTVFVTGWAEWTGGDTRAMTRACSPSGDWDWADSFDLGTITRATGVSCVPDGVYVATTEYAPGEVPLTARLLKYTPADGTLEWPASWPTVPGGAAYEFLDVAAWPGLGAMAVGDYALVPGVGLCAVYVDSGATNVAGYTWTDPIMPMTATHATTGALEFYVVGYRDDDLFVESVSWVGPPEAWDYTGHQMSVCQGLVTRGDQLYVVGYAMNPGKSLQAFLVKLTP